MILYLNSKNVVNIKSKSLFTNHVLTKKSESKVSIWISVTKIDRGHLLTKFRKFFKSLVSQRGQCRAAIELNVITDIVSRPTVNNVIYELNKQYKETYLTVIFLNYIQVMFNNILNV